MRGYTHAKLTTKATIISIQVRHTTGLAKGPSTVAVVRDGHPMGVPRWLSHSQAEDGLYPGMFP